MCIDEASRKNKFQLLAESQESKIKDYVLSLDLSKSNSNPLGQARSNFISNTTKQSLLNTPIISTSTKLDQPARRSISNYSPPFALPLRSKISHKSNTVPSTPSSTTEKNNIECCDVKITYWFQEDNFQHLFFISLMLVLVASRWLITRSELNLNQRGLILVISVATAADTLDFFSYLNMEIVYRNNYLLFSVLLILSLSLIQFVFLHLDDGFNLRNYKNIQNEPTEPEISEKIPNKNEKFPLFKKQYQYLKKHLSLNDQVNQPEEQFAFKRAYKPKNRSKNFLCYIFCCCLEQQDPLFFILLAGLFLHDGSFLTFRIFALSKLGIETILNQNPLLIFFMIKNIFIILTQIYKVYRVSNEKRQKKILDNYRDFVMSHQDINMNNNGSNSNFQSQIAAAATGGQIPLVPVGAYNKQAFQANNAYRFAQIYADTGAQLAANRVFNRSLTTLGSVNNGFFTDNNSTKGEDYYPAYQFQQQESVIGQLNKQQQQYDANITLCPSTPANPFSAKVGKALYGLPFINRSKSSLSGADLNMTNGPGVATTFRNASFNQSFRNNNNNNSNKNLKASKI